MAFSTIFNVVPSSLSSLNALCFRNSRTHLTQNPFSCKPLIVKASISFDYSPSSVSGTSTKNNKWVWKYKDNAVNIYYEEHDKGSHEACKNILMIPSISDVSTVEEWRSVAKDIAGRSGKFNYRTTIVDWPGLGYSDRPKLDFNADVMEKFLVDFINAPDGPVNNLAIASITPTWAGPLPIRDLEGPAVGWMMYNVLVSNEKSIQSQYKSHVYADPGKVTPDIIESRYALTKRQGARYVPAAFLTGLLDPVKSREEFVQLFAELEGRIPCLVLATACSPKREAKGVSNYVEVPGALLPQEEYPEIVAEQLYRFLQEI
ncbi:unnamed protein product [Withania somnifera]